LLAALTDAGCPVQVLEGADQHGGDFMRLQVHRDTVGNDDVEAEAVQARFRPYS
jgi:hypothetical protein